jgi:hypothetical protein
MFDPTTTIETDKISATDYSGYQPNEAALAAIDACDSLLAWMREREALRDAEELVSPPTSGPVSHYLDGLIDLDDLPGGGTVTRLRIPTSQSSLEATGASLGGFQGEGGGKRIGADLNASERIFEKKIAGVKSIHVPDSCSPEAPFPGGEAADLHGPQGPLSAASPREEDSLPISGDIATVGGRDVAREPQAPEKPSPTSGTTAPRCCPSSLRSSGQHHSGAPIGRRPQPQSLKRLVEVTYGEVVDESKVTHGEIPGNVWFSPIRCETLRSMYLSRPEGRPLVGRCDTLAEKVTPASRKQGGGRRGPTAREISNLLLLILDRMNRETGVSLLTHEIIASSLGWIDGVSGDLEKPMAMKVCRMLRLFTIEPDVDTKPRIPLVLMVARGFNRPGHNRPSIYRPMNELVGKLRPVPTRTGDR